MAADPTYQTGRVQRRQDGSLDVPSGAVLNIETGGALQVNGVDITAAAGSGLAGVAAGYKLARGMATTASASDTIVTGLATVVAAIANLEDAPLITVDSATAFVGDQAGTPAAGSILLKTWSPTSSANPTKIAAATFSKKCSWIAIGT